MYLNNLTMKTLTFLLIFIGISMHAQETPVTFEQLPAEARSFIKQHFKSPFHHAIKEVERRSISYEAVLENNTEIEFSEAGRWIEVNGKGNPVPLSLIEKQVSDYVLINYPAEAITKIERKDTGYEVELTSGTGLKFDAQGIFEKVN